MKKVQKRLKSPIKGEVVNLSNFERVLLKLLHSGFELYIGISNIGNVTSPILKILIFKNLMTRYKTPRSIRPIKLNRTGISNRFLREKKIK